MLGGITFDELAPSWPRGAVIKICYTQGLSIITTGYEEDDLYLLFKGAFLIQYTPCQRYAEIFKFYVIGHLHTSY